MKYSTRFCVTDGNVNFGVNDWVTIEQCDGEKCYGCITDIDEDHITLKTESEKRIFEIFYIYKIEK